MSTLNRTQRRQLKDILVSEGFVSPPDMEEALRIQGTTGENLTAILADMDCISSLDVCKIISGHFQLPFITLQNYDFDPKLARKFPPDFLHQHKVLPFDKIGQMILLAVADIPDERILSEVPRQTKCNVALYVALLDEISKQLDENCPLPKDSEFLRRRSHVRPRKKADASAPALQSHQVFTESSGESLLDALDSTWDSIFETIEKNEQSAQSAQRAQERPKKRGEQ